MQIYIHKSTATQVQAQLASMTQTCALVLGEKSATPKPLSGTTAYENFEVTETSAEFVITINDEIITRYMHVCIRFVIAITPLVKLAMDAFKSMSKDAEDLATFITKRKE